MDSLTFNKLLKEGRDPRVQNLKEQIFQLFVDLHIGFNIHHVARDYLLFRLEMHKSLDRLRKYPMDYDALVFTEHMDFASAKSIEFWSLIEILFDQTEDEMDDDQMPLSNKKDKMVN